MEKPAVSSYFMHQLTLPSPSYFIGIVNSLKCLQYII